MTTAKERLISAVKNKLNNLGMGVSAQGNSVILENVLDALKAMNLVQCHQMEEKLIEAALKAYQFELKYGCDAKMKPVSPLNYFQYMPKHIKEEFNESIYY